MVSKTDDIRIWESVEIERSASEAMRRADDDLRIPDDIIARYSNPPATTPFALEYLYHLLGDAHGLKVLDYGCGAGKNSVVIAAHDGDVIGVDISPELIDMASRRLALHGMETRADFRVGSAHELPLDDESIDVVFGNAILHHLDLGLASRETFRVLRKGGRALFLEPVRNSKFVAFVRGLIPYQQPDLSPFERPLTDAELQAFAAPFETFASRAFNLPFVNLIEVLGLSESLLHAAIRLDGRLLGAVPPLAWFATVRVVEMKK